MTKTRTSLQIAQDYLVFGIDYIPFDEVIQMLRAADELYHGVEESFLSDSEYDEAYRFAQRKEPTHTYFLGTGSKVRGSKIKLPYPMGSLTQVYEGETAKWITQSGADSTSVIITDKLDGLSALLVYDHQGKLQIAYSRGDGIEGADITRHISLIPSVPQQVRNANLVVRGEVIMKKLNFPTAQSTMKTRSGQLYKNSRNMTAGLMNSSSNPAAIYQLLDFVAYEIVAGGDHTMKSLMLDELVIKHGFLVPGWQSYNAHELNDTILIDRLNQRRTESVYELDGLVLDFNNSDYRQGYDTSSLNPKYARKFKIAEASNLAEATVVEVELNLSKDGYFKPRVKIEPVELVGVTVQYATGFNAKFIYDNQIGPGAVIKITRSGDVIPFITGVVSPAIVSDFNTWFEMQFEAYGDWKWTETGVDVILVDAASNEKVQFERLLDFFNTIDIPAMKEGNLQEIFRAGFTTPEDVLNLTGAELQSLLGRSIGAKIQQGLREKFTNIPLYLLMGAHPSFGRGVGVRKMKKLYDKFEGKLEMFRFPSNIVLIEGFEAKTAQKIANGYQTFMQFLDDVKRVVTIAPYQAPAQGQLSGLTVVFTGFRDEDLEKAIESAGGKIGSTVSKNTSLLVAADPDSTSGKAAKARELGVKVISPDEMRTMV